MTTLALLLLLLAPAQTETPETPARLLDPVLVSEYGTKCSRSYDPKRCLRWFVLMNEALDIEAELDAPSPVGYDRATTEQNGRRAGRLKRLSEIPAEMKRLLPKVRGAENRRRLSALVEGMEAADD